MISVIVPIYNVEKYLEKCIKSILAQTYTDFELILVDDGSPDNCPLICDKYAAENPNIRVIHKKNGGLSDARNVGTMAANGKYITYIDSDDYVANDYLSTLITLIEKNTADIAVTGIEEFFDEEIVFSKHNNTTYIYSGEEALEKMLYQDTLDTSACAMLLPTKIAQTYLFPVGKYHEDEFTTYKFFASSRKVCVTTKKQYFYLQRHGSIMHAFGQASLDELDAADNLVKFCQEHYPSLVFAAESKKFSDYCQVLLSNSCLKNDYPTIYYRINTYLKGKRKQILLDKKCRAKNRLAAALLLFGNTPLFVANKVKNRDIIQ